MNILESDGYSMQCSTYSRQSDHTVRMPARHCKTIHTTNAITPLNSMIRKAIKNRKVFPHNKTILKIVYLAIHAVAKKWSRSLQNW